MQITKSRVLEAYATAPHVVRKAFSSEEVSEVVRSIQNEYHLHVDVAGELRKQVGYMMLGLISPTEFFGQLVLDGFDQNSARAVLDAVNRRIFIPLQEKVRKDQEGGETLDTDFLTYAEREEQEEGDESVIATTPTTSQPPTGPYSGMQVERAQPSHLGVSVPNLLATPQAGIEQSQTLPQNITPALAQQAPAIQAMPVAQPLVRTMSHDIELLQHPELVGHPTPASSFQTASIPVTSVPAPSMAMPASTPVPPPPQIQQAMAARPAPTFQTLPGSSAPVPARSEPLVQKHTGDPYREPIE